MAISRFLKRTFLGLLILLGVLLLLILPQNVDPSQDLTPSLAHDYPDTLGLERLDWDSIDSRLGNSFQFDNKFSFAEKLALTAYPELKDASIHFVLTDGGAPMESNFKLTTLLGDRKNRVYEVRLNDAENSMFEGILMRDLHFNAQVGIIAHELGHVLYYEQLSTLQIAKWGLMYLFSFDFRATHERTTDELVVYRGLGSQLYQYAWFVRYAPQNKELYVNWGQFMDKFYLTDKEILKKQRELQQSGD